MFLRDSTPLAVAARHAVSHEQRRAKAAAASALSIAKVQLELDRDIEARECRAFAREEARTRRISHLAIATFLCGGGDTAPPRGHAPGCTPSAGSTVPPTLLGDGVDAVRVCCVPQAATRKRSARAYDDAQRANAVKQNARRGAILKEKTAAKRNANATQPVVHDTRAVIGAKAVAVVTNDTRIVGAVADWWDRKRSAPPATTGFGVTETGVKRFRLYSKTRVHEPAGD